MRICSKKNFNRLILVETIYKTGDNQSSVLFLSGTIMDLLNQTYNDILKSLNLPNVIIKEFAHDVAFDRYYSMRNDEKR